MEDNRRKKKEIKTIALLASKNLRNGPNSDLIKFVQEFESFFREVRKPTIYAIGGTYRSLLSNGILDGEGELEPVDAGFRGLVQMAAMVANGAIDLIIYLIDPRDPSSLFWETLAFKRECVVKEIPFISTYKGAREWASLEWFNQGSGKYLLTKEEEKKFLRKKIAKEERKKDSIKVQSIALIAHDKKKPEMVLFAYRYFDLLNKFKKRHATGTTGHYLNEIEKSRGKKRKEGEEDWVKPSNSGPKGGDVQIAEEIRTEKCHRVVFFEDPHVPHEHESAIQLLERTARIPELNIPFLHDRNSATIWVENLEKYQKKSKTDYTEPLTLVRAYRLIYNVELVLADSAMDPWNAILKKAAGYLYGSIIQKAKERLLEGEKIHVGVPWGASINKLIVYMQELQKKLQKHGKNTPTALGDRSPNTRNVVIEPLVGIRGTPDESREANYNSEQLAEFLGGTAHQLSRVVFSVNRSEDEKKGKKNKNSDRWNNLDIAIFNCSESEKIEPFLDSQQTVRVPDALYHQMLKEKPAGDISGIYLSKQGKQIELDGFTRTGISYKQLKTIAKKGGAILIAGEREGKETHRHIMALAAIRGKLVSVFVTDLNFALKILNLDKSTEADKA